LIEGVRTLRLSTTALKRLTLLLLVVALGLAVGCGGSGAVRINNPENFTNADLKGSYVYQIRGGDFQLNMYRETGVFTADGAGHITGGVDDTSGNPTGTAFTGTYSIFADGTGSLTMAFQQGTLTLAVTMVSQSKLYLMEADTTLNATGTAELQDSTAIASAPTGTFAFRIHEEVSSSSQTPASVVGAFTLPGSAVNGAMDQNANGTFSSPGVTFAFNAPGALGRGAGSFLNASTSVTSNFVYYIVNSNKLVLLMSDPSILGSGSAEAQSGTIGNGLSGNYAFGSSGDNSNYTLGLFGTVGTVGEFTASGGNLSGTEDSMVNSTFNATAPISGCYTASANGRVTVTSVSGNTCSSTVTQVFWMVNPNRAFFLNVNNASYEDGTADLQTVSNFSQSTLNGQFAMVMGGTDLTPLQIQFPPQLLSRIGVVQLDSAGKVTINELANSTNSGNGGQSPGLLSGSYAISSNGRITGGAGNSTGGFDFVMYGVSGTQAYALQSDAGVITSGTIEHQP
jgi:hypothetical protein